MSRHGDDAHIAVVVATALVVGTDGHEAGILAAGPRVGLQADRVKACDGGQLLRQVLQRREARQGTRQQC